jgi:hypothetical protein
VVSHKEAVGQVVDHKEAASQVVGHKVAVGLVSHQVIAIVVDKLEVAVLTWVGQNLVVALEVVSHAEVVLVVELRHILVDLVEEDSLMGLHLMELHKVVAEVIHLLEVVMEILEVVVNRNLRQHFVTNFVLQFLFHHMPNLLFMVF